MKPLNRKNYGSIPHLSNSKLGEKDYKITEGQERIITIKKRDKNDTILVFEKYDGSNVGVAKKDGNIFALTRSGYEASTSPYKQHHEFAKWVGKRFNMFNEILEDGERLAGEWLLQAHGLRYDIKTEPIVFFDWFDCKNSRKIFGELHNLTLKYPIKTVRVLHIGNAIKPTDLIDLLNDRDGLISSVEKPEGMVFRVERNGKVDFLAKWVREDFEPGKFCIGVDERDLIWNISQ